MLAQEQAPVFAPSLVILLLAGSTIFLFGMLWAVMQRANSDYKKTKAALPGLRKDFWSAWWRMVKIGFWVCVGFVVLLLVAVNEVRDSPPAPASTVSPTPKITDRWVK